ncbi:MAG: hypothetical protein Kow00108_09400 [Calditrichia bacterium]
MISKIKNYLEGVRQEMKKVTWPEFDELKSTTMVVIIATLIFTLFIFFSDVIFGKVVNLIFSLFA